MYANVVGSMEALLFKINRSFNSTADALAKQAHASTLTELDHSCNRLACGPLCSILQALLTVDLYNVHIITASCCF